LRLGCSFCDKVGAVGSLISCGLLVNTHTVNFSRFWISLKSDPMAILVTFIGDQIGPMWDFVSVTSPRVVGRGSDTTPACG
jgi:hypothetical protein